MAISGQDRRILDRLRDHAVGRSRARHSVTMDDFRPLFRSRFPRHHHEIEHPKLMDPMAWMVGAQLSV